MSMLSNLDLIRRVPLFSMLTAEQAKVIADVRPYADRLPHWLYYRLFDREYFALAIDR